MLADHHLAFTKCQTISLPETINYFGYRVLRGHLIPYGFHHHAMRNLDSQVPDTIALFKWYTLVVEPSPGFRPRSSAADCPLFIPAAFRPLTLSLSAYVVGSRALGGSSNSPGLRPGITSRGTLPIIYLSS